MKHLVIIGAGGMGRTIYSNVLESIGYGSDFIVKGFINDVPSLEDYDNYPPIVGTIEDYYPQSDDVFICSIGNKFRKECIDKIQKRGGIFINIIHKTARIYNNVKLGVGNFVGAYSVLGNDSSIGDFNMIQSYVVIGHDAVIGNYNRIDTHVTCVGGIILGNLINVHTSAVISHNVQIGDNATVAALSFVIRRVKEGTTVMGNPAKKLM